MNIYPNNLQEFKQEFATEQQCINYLFQLRWENGYHCPRCGYQKSWKITESKYKCQNCAYQTTVISGTLLNGTHLPLTTWFNAVWYISSNKDGTSALALQTALNLGSYHTSWSLLNKLRTAMMYSECDKLRGKVIVSVIPMYPISSSTFSFSHIAIEVEGTKCCRIRLQDENANLQNFVMKNIEKGSTIVTHDKGLYYKLLDEYKVKFKKIKYGSYSLPQTDIVKDYLVKKNLISTKQASKSSDNRNLYLNECCFKFNRRNEKTGVLFYDILKGTMKY